MSYHRFRVNNIRQEKVSSSQAFSAILLPCMLNKTLCSCAFYFTNIILLQDYYVLLFSFISAYYCIGGCDKDCSETLHTVNTVHRIDADDNRVSIELLASTEEIWAVTINEKQQVDLIKSDNTWWAAKQIISNRGTSIIRKLNIVITAPECIASIMMEILSKNKCTPNASASSKTSTEVDNISQFLWKNNHTQKSTIKKPTQSMDLYPTYNLQREYLEAVHDWITTFGI
ncbi:hypothetical protein Tsp_09588 [Trichinella spiralis]|uniref:hypothetical protein n=1 Tax=Trichinella spiralis TaxID=6334 RepID=UPI0001EFEE42|nr:hypothetical protein Tsp_09588 [Trichinella spiralis]